MIGSVNAPGTSGDLQWQFVGVGAFQLADASVGKDDCGQIIIIGEFDEYIFREGDEGNRLYIVSKGEVRISRDVPGTGEEAIAILKQGACFGEMAVLDPSARSTDAIANSRCTLPSIARSDFELLLDSDRDLAHKLLWSVVRLLCQRLRITNDNLRFVLVVSMF